MKVFLAVLQKMTDTSEPRTLFGPEMEKLSLGDRCARRADYLFNFKPRRFARFLTPLLPISPVTRPTGADGVWQHVMA